MSSELAFWQPCDRFVLEFAVADTSQAPWPLRDENVAARKKDHAPRAVQAFRNRDDANLLCVGFKLQTPPWVLPRTCGRKQDECRDNCEETNKLCDGRTHEGEWYQSSAMPSIKRTSAGL